MHLAKKAPLASVTGCSVPRGISLIPPGVTAYNFITVPAGTPACTVPVIPLAEVQVIEATGRLKLPVQLLPPTVTVLELSEMVSEAEVFWAVAYTFWPATKPPAKFMLQVPLASTVVVPDATPFRKTKIVVPGPSTEVPATVVAPSITGEFTTGGSDRSAPKFPPP